jgi:uncharacterized protein YkwD
MKNILTFAFILITSLVHAQSGRDHKVTYVDAHNTNVIYMADESNNKNLKPVTPNPNKNFSDVWKVAELLNAYRVQNGAKPLVYDIQLSEAAKVQAQYIMRVGYQTHDNAQYPTVTSRLNLTTYRHKSTTHTITSENVVYMKKPTRGLLYNFDYNTLEVYKLSPSHNKTMLSGDFTHFGCYTIYDGNNAANVFVFAN